MNNYIEKIEELVAKWLKPLPHLPVNFTKWVATNLWWIVLIGVILSALGVIALISGLTVVLGLVGTTTGIFGVFTVSLFAWFPILLAAISIILMIGTVVLTAMAISPLKLSLKKGWSLLFIVLLIQAVYIVLGAISKDGFFSSISSLLSGGISIAISAYLLFELRSYFVGSAVKASVIPTK